MESLQGIDGKTISSIAQQTFGRTNISKEELSYVLSMMVPSSYILRNHKVKNHPITFHIGGHDSERAQAHRP